MSIIIYAAAIASVGGGTWAGTVAGAVNLAQSPSLDPQRRAAPPAPVPVSQANQPDPLDAEIRRVGETATRVTLIIAEDGRVQPCSVTQVSASPALDAEACRILSAGHLIAPPGTSGLRTLSQRIVWRIEE